MAPKLNFKLINYHDRFPTQKYPCHFIRAVQTSFPIIPLQYSLVSLGSLYKVFPYFAIIDTSLILSGTTDTTSVLPGITDTTSVLPGITDTPSILPGNTDTPSVLPGIVGVPIKRLPVLGHILPNKVLGFVLHRVATVQLFDARQLLQFLHHHEMRQLQTNRSEHLKFILTYLS